jgi:peroxiredoxin
VADRFGEFRKLGVGVVAVSMSTASGVALYLKERPLPFPLLADPERKGYATLELGRTTWTRMIGLGTIWRFTGYVLRGARIKRVAKEEDALQTGGDFLIGPDRRLAWGHTSPDPTARPTVDALLQRCRETFPAPADPVPAP